MDYIKLIKKAFKITWKNKFLWIFGLFAGTTGAAYGGKFQYLFDNNSTANFNTSGLTKISSYAIIHEPLIILAVLIALVLMLVALVFSVVSSGALIGSVPEILKNKVLSFRESFTIGWNNFWRVFGFGLVAGSFYVAVVAIVSVPSVILGVAKLYWPMALFIIFFILVLLVFSFFYFFIVTIAARILIIEKTGIFASFELAYKLYLKKWKEILVVWLANLALSIIWGICIVIAAIIIVIILIILGIAIALVSKILSVIIVGLLAIAVILFMVLFAGAFNTFISLLWTLSYLEIKK